MHAIRPMVLILALAALLGGALCCSAQADGAVQIIAQGKDLVASSGERPLFAYRVEPSPLKPYVVRLFTPGGINVLRDAPADHLHHHALMFAFGVNGTSFWTEGADDKTGSQVPRGLTTSAATGGDASTAGLVQELDWLMADKSAVLTERRSIEAIEQPGQGATLLTWRSQLRSAREGVTLDGSHYYGLGMRFLTSMDKGGRFFNAADDPGEVVRGDERLVGGAWCAYTASADGRSVTVAIFNHPRNPRPARFFVMSTPFAYLAATINLWKEPLPLAPGSELSLVYGVAAWDGEVDKGRIDALHRRWVEIVQGEK